jgi:hypothetical protein
VPGVPLEHARVPDESRLEWAARGWPVQVVKDTATKTARAVVEIQVARHSHYSHLAPFSSSLVLVFSLIRAAFSDGIS